MNAARKPIRWSLTEYGTVQEALLAMMTAVERADATKSPIVWEYLCTIRDCIAARAVPDEYFEK